MGRTCTPPGAQRATASVVEEILRSYVGEYVISAALSITVMFEGGALYAQPTGEGKRSTRARARRRGVK